MVLIGKSSQEYSVNAAITQSFILGSTLFLQYINDFPDDVICKIADDISAYDNCCQVRAGALS